MHMKPMSESEGTFDSGWRDSPRPCPHCKVTGQRQYRVWESDCGGYEDEKNRCLACGKIWWIEGPDA
jgi:hypothetical protein